MRRHGSLGRESTKDAHGINEIAQEWDGNDLIHRLVEGIKGKGQVEKDIWMSQDKREGAGRGGQETCILTQIQKGHRGGRTTQGLETSTKGVPFLRKLS